jgi:hypothetical protein
MLPSSLPVLILGCALGGVSTTLLFSVFETWMISEYHARGAEMAGLDLASVLSRMTTLGSVVAILVGVLGDMLVQATGSRTTPFVASMCCITINAILLLRRRDENYGESASGNTALSALSDWTSLLRNPQILALALTSCVFEGMMYLFILF